VVSERFDTATLHSSARASRQWSRMVLQLHPQRRSRLLAAKPTPKRLVDRLAGTFVYALFLSGGRLLVDGDDHDDLAVFPRVTLMSRYFHPERPSGSTTRGPGLSDAVRVVGVEEPDPLPVTLQ
jgi:hypothetical protein